ncbi:4-coumarate--CoA ligase-like 5 isoform X2 [Panicum virgatum]|uniref:4-coumarate--CoA ligase-like 5 isoform X2 n=1 Tax=Panicum virgatum TaxID=38727 RepID=UPI0019D557E7|nr:4-coumarate--CoA ligase-like 5 isoform X2 [Panicum virgatum]
MFQSVSAESRMFFSPRVHLTRPPHPLQSRASITQARSLTSHPRRTPPNPLACADPIHPRRSSDTSLATRSVAVAVAVAVARAGKGGLPLPGQRARRCAPCPPGRLPWRCRVCPRAARRPRPDVPVLYYVLMSVGAVVSPANPTLTAGKISGLVALSGLPSPSPSRPPQASSLPGKGGAPPCVAGSAAKPLHHAATAFTPSCAAAAAAPPCADAARHWGWWRRVHKPLALLWRSYTVHATLQNTEEREGKDAAAAGPQPGRASAAVRRCLLRAGDCRVPVLLRNRVISRGSKLNS